jgi:hypothetical protein
VWLVIWQLPKCTRCPYESWAISDHVPPLLITAGAVAAGPGLADALAAGAAGVRDGVGPAAVATSHPRQQGRSR